MIASRRAGLWVVGLVLLVTGTGVSWAQQLDKHAAHRAEMDKPRYTVSDVNYQIPDVQLIDEDGEVVALRGLLESEHPVALNFIFTTCTTICPVMTVTFSQMQRTLGVNAKDLQLVSVTIDPEYDRPGVLKAYAEQFQAEENWTFLTGDSNDIADVLRSFDSYAGSKMNHQPVTLLRNPDRDGWTRIEGLANGASLAQEVTNRLLL
jgi:protein SCO1/2